jgi:23S rRNA pseudouridine1911/1915/1917 synthase
MTHLSIEPNELITYKIIHQDDDVLVVNKPARIVTTPGLGHERNSLLNGLFAVFGAKLQNLGKDRDFGLLHRLDRETSGLVIVALRARAYDALRTMFEERAIAKYYWAMCAGTPSQPSGVIKRPIAEYQGRLAGERSNKKLARISSAGKPAATAYRVLESNPQATLVECRALTGRLHQVRVHMTCIKCPIYGDEFYAEPSITAAAPRLALHAHRVVFTHPVTGQEVDARSPWPDDLKGLLRRFRIKRPLAPAMTAEDALPDVD